MFRGINGRLCGDVSFVPLISFLKGLKGCPKSSQMPQNDVNVWLYSWIIRRLAFGRAMIIDFERSCLVFGTVWFYIMSGTLDKLRNQQIKIIYLSLRKIYHAT